MMLCMIARMITAGIFFSFCRLVSETTWRAIEEKATNTVVQLTVYHVQHDMAQPFASPTVLGGHASGFFIEIENGDRGYIVTNAHVLESAYSVWVHVPALGSQVILDADIVSVCPERDLALLKLTDHAYRAVYDTLGFIPALSLGNSDDVLRSDEVLALGYPLGYDSVKSTMGVISGCHGHYLQTDAPLNPGNSGGPLLSSHGEVIGINSSGRTEAQNIGYAIPVNDLKVILPDFFKKRLLKNSFLGIMCHRATDELVTYLGNPLPGGYYVAHVEKESITHYAGLKRGDMIYAINGYTVNKFGEVTVPWSADKISLATFIFSRLGLEETITFTVYRSGEKVDIIAYLNNDQSHYMVDMVYPTFEGIDYEIFGGCVVLPLTINHIQLFKEQAPCLVQYGKSDHPLLIITHIFPNSQLFRTQTVRAASVIHEVNGKRVHTLNEFRDAVRDSVHTGQFSLKAFDNSAWGTCRVPFFIILDFEKILREEQRLSRDFRYTITPFTHSLLEQLSH